MTMTEMASRLNDIASSWEEFKNIHDNGLSKKSGKTSMDTATLEKLQRINNAIDEYKERLDMLEIAAQRPNLNDIGDDYEHDYKYDQSFTNYLHKGNDFSYKQDDETSLVAQTNRRGGFLLPKNISKYIGRSLTTLSPMRQICSVEQISGDRLEHLATDNSAISVGWRDETERNSPDTPLEFRKIDIYVNELYTQPQISKRLLDDAIIDIGKWLIERVVEAFSIAENKAFIVGPNNQEPKGILAYGDGKNDITKIERIKVDNLDSEAIIKLYYSLNEIYAPRACFLMNRSVLQQIRLMKLSTGQYLWQPGLSVGAPDTLMGIPVYQIENMPMFDQPDKPIIAIGDFKRAYKIVDNHDVRVLRDPFTNKPYVIFYTTKRVGGGVINGNAIKFLQLNKKSKAPVTSSSTGD